MSSFSHLDQAYVVPSRFIVAAVDDAFSTGAEGGMRMIPRVVADAAGLTNERGVHGTHGKTRKEESDREAVTEGLSNPR